MTSSIAQPCAALIASAVILTVGGCSQSQPHHAVPAPAGAIAAAPLGDDRFAVLAGSDQTKGIFVIDLVQGARLKSFAVTTASTGIAAAFDNRSVLVSVGGVVKHRPFGALEQWGLDGVKRRVLAMPSQALGITRAVDGVSYVLLGGQERARAALPVQGEALRVGKAIPLDAGARDLQQCRIGALDYLVYTDGGQGLVTVREVESGTTLRSSVVADSPECDDSGHLFAIRKGFTARSVAILQVPVLEQIGSIPASNSARSLYELGSHGLVALNATENVSSLEVFPDPTSVIASK